MARLFVAVRPPADVLDAVEALPRAEEAGVRWVPRAQWHITLRFLGQASSDEAAAALAAMPWTGSEPVSALAGPQVSRLGRAVICLPVAGLDVLAGAVEAATGGLGDPPDPRPYAGHLTLARLKHRGACRLTGTRLVAAFPVTEIELVRSTLGTGGAHHEVVARRSLGPDPTA